LKYGNLKIITPTLNADRVFTIGV